MNDFLRSFIMTAIRNMIDRGVALYQVYRYAAAWYDKGVLLEEDLAEIHGSYETVENTGSNTEETAE